METIHQIVSLEAQKQLDDAIQSLSKIHTLIRAIRNECDELKECGAIDTINNILTKVKQ